jgi:hypothetical protein
LAKLIPGFPNAVNSQLVVNGMPSSVFGTKSIPNPF